MALLTVTASGVDVAVRPLIGVWVRVAVRVGVALRVGDGGIVLVAVRVTVGNGDRVIDGVTVAVLVDVRVAVGDGVFVGVRMTLGVGVREAVGPIGAAPIRGAGETANANASNAQVGVTTMNLLVDLRRPVIL
ncbi:MAG: hypothetical protein EXR45_08370 [Chloroflexi bacterium]|nr:hypothetical protein [Chloroflexota bacterium]